MSNLAIRNLITGINEASSDAGRHPGWPNEKVAAAAIEQIAQEWSGPETVNGLLPKEAALEIEARLIEAATNLKKMGHAPQGRTKTASVEDLRGRAGAASNFWIDRMLKQAGAGSLTEAGPNTLTDAAGTDAMAALELSQRPVGYAEQPQGADTMLPSPGITGPKEIADPARPEVSPMISNSLTDQSAKAAADRLYASLKQAGVEDRVAKVAAAGFMTPVFAALSDAHVKAAMATLKKEDQDALVKVAAMGKAPQAGVIGFLADRLIKIATDEQIAKQVPAAVSTAREYAKTASVNYNAYKAERQATKLAAAALGNKLAGGEDTEFGDGNPAEGPTGAEPPMPEAPAAEPPADEQTALLQMIWEKLKSLAPEDDESQAAVAGLMDHPQGQEVLAHVANTAKTAADASALLRKVFADNRDALTKCASAETRQLVKTEFAKTATARRNPQTFASKLKLAGAGSLTPHGPNTVADAAKTDELAAVEKQQRPAGYAENAQGKAPVSAPSTPETVVQAPRDGVPFVSADNVVAREDKKAEDASYMAAFSKVAAAYGSTLPVGWTESQKVAALQQILAAPPSNRDARLRELLSAG